MTFLGFILGVVFTLIMEVAGVVFVSAVRDMDKKEKKDEEEAEIEYYD